LVGLALWRGRQHDNHRDDSETSRFDRLDVKGFILYDGKDATRHFERDHDLVVKTKKALACGDQSAVLLIPLAIHENEGNW